MTPDPFEGEKVILRPFEPGDQPALAQYVNLPELIGRRYLPWGLPDVAPLSQGQIAGMLERVAKEERGLTLAVARLVGGELLGHASANWHWDPHSPSVAVVIAPGRQRQGFGSEALQLLLRYLFDCTVAHTIMAWIAEWNEPALAFAKKNGFQAGGRQRRSGFFQGRPYDTIIADLLRPEWKAATGK